MEIGYALIRDLIFCCFDVYMLIIFFNSLFAKKVPRLGLWCNCIVMALVLFIINSLKLSTYNFFVVPLLVFFFTKVTFNISVQRGIIYTLIYYIVFCCGKEMAFEMLLRFIAAVFPQWNAGLRSFQGTIFLLLEYILSCLFLLYIRKYTSKLEIGEDSRFDWFLLIMPVASIMILFSFVYVEFPEERYIQILMCGGAFLLYFSNAAIFIILAHYTKALNQVKIDELSLLKKDMEKNNFAEIEKLNDVYRKYIHDIHQYFYQIRSLALTGENRIIVDIIEGWENGLKKEQQNKLYTGSAVFNSILAEYIQKAKEKNIDITVFAENSISLDCIQDNDKISLFGNLLENAVEAASKCEAGNRKIQIELFMGSQYMLVFQIKNTWIQDLRKEGERLLSTKKGTRNHGLGVGIAKELAKKYGGNLELEGEGEWFITTLMIACC